MGTTTRLGLPYPEPGDLVTNGAAAIKALADAVDAAPPAFAAIMAMGSTVTIPQGSWVDLTQWTESEDTTNALSGGVFTCAVRGIYLFTANVGWQSNASGQRYLALWRDPIGAPGMVEIPGASFSMVPSVDPRMSSAAIVELDPGDTVNVRVFQTSGGNLNLNTGNYQNSFGGTLLVRTAS